MSKQAVAPRFNEADLKVIDERRGTITRTEYVKSIVQAALYSVKAKKPEPRKHTCGTPFKIYAVREMQGTPEHADLVIVGGFAICPKCHISERLTLDEYNAQAQNR